MKYVGTHKTITLANIAKVIDWDSTIETNCFAKLTILLFNHDFNAETRLDVSYGIIMPIILDKEPEIVELLLKYDFLRSSSEELFIPYSIDVTTKEVDDAIKRLFYEGIKNYNSSLNDDYIEIIKYIYKSLSIE